VAKRKIRTRDKFDRFQANEKKNLARGSTTREALARRKLERRVQQTTKRSGRASEKKQDRWQQQNKEHNQGEIGSDVKQIGWVALVRRSRTECEREREEN
jgi:hypothetical protein